MADTGRGQVSRSAAEVYEEFYIPALFQEWADRVAAGVEPGQRVLDVACGTGVLTRTVAARVGPESVVGLDINDGMLAVARRRAPAIEWRQGPAEELAFEDESFDAVVCQFGLMFFDDPRAAVREMVRVLRPGGRVAVAVWDRLENTPGYAAVVDLLRRRFGEQVADGLRAPFSMGDPRLLHDLFTVTGLSAVDVATEQGTARFPSIREWIYTDVKGWTIDEMIDDAQLAALLDEAERVLRPFVTTDGSVAFPTSAHIVTGRKD